MLDCENAPMITPPTTPAIMPEIGGALLAMAMPKHKGNATKNTTKLADKSAFIVFPNKFFMLINWLWPVQILALVY
jgi:hypothetical protein